MADHIRPMLGEDPIERLTIANVRFVEVSRHIHVAPLACRQGIDNGYVVTNGQEAIHDVRANEPGPAGNQHPHEID